jgi:hypothetical protein
MSCMSIVHVNSAEGWLGGEGETAPPPPHTFTYNTKPYFGLNVEGDENNLGKVEWSGSHPPRGVGAHDVPP